MRMCMVGRARGNATRMRVATNRAGILLAIMPPGVLWTPVTEEFRGWLDIGATGDLEMASDSMFEARMEFWDSLFPLAASP